MAPIGIPYYGDGKDSGIEEIYVNLKKNVAAVDNRNDMEHVYGMCFHNPEFAATIGKFNYLVAGTSSSNPEARSISDIWYQFLTDKGVYA
jgi:hypothetical protein